MLSRNKVTLAEQVISYQRSRHPEARRALKTALAGLAYGRGDIKALEDDLAGFYRLAVGSHRIIFAVEDGNIRCIYAEQRQMVYALFAARLRELLE